ncbi:hypothetical protein K469DRAFT_726555 [Zopfia rhizophila CBS 207.26]|uniref:AB hydrolase-1 domain-containing protein n=1 Tax=Zopfia rhizophila CBS 207.26 TaxID=1314779 RepID=A0A6A6E5D4_9PEZI|nr:hypothetical protein K469DRAFT_726555 [Zopfia rhizophila CBS 207.26]
MIGNSGPEQIFIHTCITLLQCIAPLSVGYSVVLILYPPNSFRLPYFLENCAIAETLFYFLFYLYRIYYIQRPAVHPPLPSAGKRRELVKRCFENIPDHEKYISKWFRDAPLHDVKRDNIKDFFRWAFFNTATPDPAHDSELEEYVKEFERRIGRDFQPGRGNVKCLRLTLDKSDTLHRSLIWYLCVFIVDNFTYFSMLFYKFRFHSTSSIHGLSVFPPRPQTLFGSRRSSAKDLTYWYRPHSSCSKFPVLFLHGIGIGLYPYVNFLAELNQQNKDADGEVGIIAVEILPISFRITRPTPAKDEMCKQLRTILQYHGFETVTLVSHSYGSFIATHLLQDPELSGQIASIIIVDPVSILLHLPDVAYNFTVRKPNRANEWQLWYFASKDVGVAHTLSRHFFWSENILWKEDFANRQVTIFLSERDLIVDTSRIREYLLGLEKSTESPECKSVHVNDQVAPVRCKLKRSPNVVWCTGLDHGQIFDSKTWRMHLVNEITQRRIVE